MIVDPGPELTGRATPFRAGSVGSHLKTGYPLKMTQVTGDDRSFVEQRGRSNEKIDRSNRLSELLQMGKDTSVDRSQILSRPA